MAEQTKTVDRYEVPADGKPHLSWLSCPPHAIAAKRVGDDHVVEFWAEHVPGLARNAQLYQAFGTGQPIPSVSRLVGTAGVDGVAWHLYEVALGGGSG